MDNRDLRAHLLFGLHDAFGGRIAAAGEGKTWMRRVGSWQYRINPMLVDNKARVALILCVGRRSKFLTSEAESR